MWAMRCFSSSDGKADVTDVRNIAPGNAGCTFSINVAR